jgi:PAS domain S-box-containing protein
MKASSCSNVGGEGELEILRVDGQRVFCRIGRDDADNSRYAFTSVTSAAGHATPQSLNWLNQEFELRDHLDTEWAVRPLELLRERGRTMLVVEYPGGAWLDSLIGQPMEVGQFLRLAVALSAVLSRLHGRGVVHKDIKPANVLVNLQTGQVWLSGFGIASRLPRERQTPEPPEFIAGTLAYMSPEQTGRMNRSIDSRSDLYSLGVTLYEMLAGSLPFSASDPMEWVHCHIARQPRFPSEQLKNVPAAVVAIIFKLLAKTTEERYQTAAAVASDLKRCLSDWQTTGHVDNFAPGENDIPDRLLVPEKLYGREREVDTLLTAFDRIVAGGKPELVLVSGYSGIGKSAVVNELHKPLVPPRGLFASGKFDQYKRDIPYATLAQAFQSLIRPLLSKSEEDVRRWRDALHEALDPNGQLIVELVPDLKYIIGEQPPVPELPPQDAQGRFQLVFGRFISVFARPEHPLALFLDDLQWLDAATLDLLEDLVTRSELRYLLLIGAYRDNEVSPTHPLMRKLDAIRQAGAHLQDVVLGPLALGDLQQLLTDSLHCEPRRVAPLAQLILEKTRGNPFFAIQFISTLADEALLTFDYDAARWTWELGRIHAKGYTDNVVDLMVGKLSRLAAKTQDALQHFACMGNSADLEMLRMVFEGSNDKIHDCLWEAVRAGLILRSDTSYRFLHDRVQEAAYSLIPKELRAEAHLRIGTLLAANTPLERQEEAIFEIVNQLNRGSHLIRSTEERERVANLNLIAGRRAKVSTAYASAINYLRAGRKLLTETTWELGYKLIFSIEYLMAECELLTADMVAAENRLVMLAQHAKSRHDFSVVTRLRLTLHTTLDQSDRGVDVFLDYLRRGGTVWPHHPTRDEVMSEFERIGSLVGDRQIEDLLDLPLTTDPDVLDTLDVFTEIVTPALFYDENLSSLVVCRMVSLSLEHGNCDGSCFGYVWFAMFAGPRFNNYKDGFRFGQLGYDLVEKRGLTRYQARTYMSFGNLVMPWAKHAASGRELVRRAFDAAYRIGDLTFAAYSWDELITNYLMVGDGLAGVQTEAENGLAFAKRARFGLVVDLCGAQLGLVRTLRGLTTQFGSLDDEEFNESEAERHLASNPVLSLAEFFYWTRKLMARFFAGDYASAVEASLKAQQLLWTSPSQLETADFYLYGALAHAANWDSASSDERVQHLEALLDHRRQLELWAVHCPANFENRAALVGAEIARIQGHTLEAEELYETAIRSAHTNAFVHNEAVANELAAHFYEARGFWKIARAYMWDAQDCYLHWGADGKVRQLNQLYPYLKTENTVSTSTDTILAPIANLDLATVIKVSQAISGEIVLEKLIHTLMRTAIEHAGAGRGLLVLPQGDEYWLEAEARTTGDTVAVDLRGAKVTAADLPESVLHYVLRTKEGVLLHDASGDSPFASDDYIRSHKTRSILCLPLLKQARLLGLIYLENNLTLGAFTPGRMAILKLLASQAGMSLENIRLYNDLQEREAKVRLLVDTALDAVLSIDERGHITEWNAQAEAMFGWRREEVVGLRLSEILIPMQHRSDHEKGMRRFLTSGEGPILGRRLEITALRRNGTEFPVELSVAPFRIGETWAFSGFVRDITEHKRLNSELQERQARVRRLIDSNIIGIYLWNLDGRIIEANEAFLSILGYSRDDLASGCLRWTELTPAEWRDADDRGLAELMTTGTAQPYEKEFYQKTGRRVPALVGAAVFGGPSKEGVAFVVDLTDRNRAEEAARENERRYHEMQLELAHANRVATAGQLSASIAHEVNQPLAGIVFNSDTCLRMLAANPPDIDGAAETVRRTLRDAKRASEVITRLRSLFSKSDTTSELVDLNEATSEVIAMSLNELQRADVVLKSELGDGLPLVMGNRVQIQQVILNLLLNASEAMNGVDDRLRQLIVRTENEQGAGARLTVQDTGPGFELQGVDKLFEAFYTTKSNGMGMGLSISRSIIENHQGRLWAVPNDGPGATFSFSIPARPDA